MASVGIGYQPLQQFKPDYYKLPFNELLAGLSAKQKQYDEGVADTDALTKIFGEAGLRTQGQLDAVKAEYQPQIDEITNELATTGEYNPYKVTKLAQQITSDPRKKIYDYDYKLRDKVLETQASDEFPDAYMAGFNKPDKTWNPYTGQDLSGLAEGYRLIKPADWNKEYQTDLGTSIVKDIKEIDPTYSVQEIEKPDGTFDYKILKQSGEEVTWDRDLATKLLLQQTPSGRTLLDQLWETKGKEGKLFRSFQYKDLQGQEYNKEAFFNDLLDSSEGLFYKQKKLSFSDSGLKADGSGSGKSKTKPTVSLYPSEITRGESTHKVDDLSEYSDEALVKKIDETKTTFNNQSKEFLTKVQELYPELAPSVEKDENGYLRIKPLDKQLLGYDEDLQTIENEIISHNNTLATIKNNTDYLESLRFNLLTDSGLDPNFEKSSEFKGYLQTNAEKLKTQLGIKTILDNVVSEIPKESLTKKPGESGYLQEVKDYIDANPEKFVKESATMDYNAAIPDRQQKVNEYNQKLKTLSTVAAKFKGNVYTLDPSHQPDEKSKAVINGLKTAILTQAKQNFNSLQYVEDESLVTDSKNTNAADSKQIQYFLNVFDKADNLDNALVQLGFDDGDGEIKAVFTPSSAISEDGKSKMIRTDTRPIEITLSPELIKEVIQTVEEFGDKYTYLTQKEMSNSLSKNKGTLGKVETGLGNTLQTVVNTTTLGKDDEQGSIRTYKNKMTVGGKTIVFNSPSPSASVSFLTNLEKTVAKNSKASLTTEDKPDAVDAILSDVISKSNINLSSDNIKIIKDYINTNLGNFQ